MSDSIEECPDGHFCLNYSKCVHNPYDEGNYYCDCYESIFNAAYAGLKCEHKAEVYCTSEGISQTSFCTNKGTCVAQVGPDEAHLGCDCPIEYEGSFCQYVKGSRPKGWPYTESPNGLTGQITNRNNESGLAGGAIAAIVIFCVVTVVVGALLYRRQKRREKAAEDVVFGSPVELTENEDSASKLTGQDLNLEADGEVLQVALSAAKDSEDTPNNSVKKDDDQEII